MKLIGAITVVLLWYAAVGSTLLFPPIIATATLGLGTLLFYWRFMVREPVPEQAQWSYRHELPLRPLGAYAIWIAAAAVSFIAIRFPLLVIYTRFAAEPHDVTRMAALIDRPLGWLPFAIVIVATAPLIEEYVFRGLIQPALISRLGAAPAIAATAVLFAIAHGSLWELPLHVLFGIAAGVLVYRSGSLWSSIILHATVNGSMLALTPRHGDSVLVFSALSSAMLVGVSVVAIGVFCVSVVRIKPVAAAVASANNGAHSEAAD